MRAVGVFALALLGACTTPVEGGSYALPPGVASYDTLKAATDKCHADGGQLALRDGYDKRELSNYQCNIGAPR
ncbi:MAG TPA: hypothetical protein VGN38_06585 [Caulobacteraceae bacterium]|jgi:hypothetical protein|nr:hypothetical protein [Caulobacteraceae bacterium]